MQSRTILVAILFGALSVPVLADERLEPPAQELPAVPLMDVLKAVGKKTGHVFVVDRNVDAEVVVGQVELRHIDYPSLLVVLRNNRMAAIRYSGVISIIDVSTVRQYPLPILYEEDDSIAEEEWVTMVVQVQHATTTQFVPILRPLLPQQGHMAAHPESKTITLVDRYANAKRVLALIRKLDYQTTQQ